MKLLLKQRILAVYHDFHWVLVATKFLAAKLHPLYVKESEILERSELEWKFWKGWSWSQTFYLRLRNPGCHTWMMASISLVVVVRSMFCNQDFLIDYKFSMGLRSREFPGQSITFNFACWKSSSLFQMKDMRQYPMGISSTIRKCLSHILNRFYFNCINVFVWIHHTLNWRKWSYCTIEKLKLPQNIFLVSVTSSLQWQDLTAHDSWS